MLAKEKITADTKQQTLNNITTFTTTAKGVEDAELVVYIAGCPCCIGQMDGFAETYKGILETFGSEKVYLVATKSPLDVSRKKIKDVMEEIPEKIKILLVEKEGIHTEAFVDTAVKELEEVLGISMREEVYSLKKTKG